MIVFDLEANGLYEGHRDKTGEWVNPADTIWCIVIKDVITKEVNQYYEKTLPHGIAALHEADVLIGHNIINYDLQLLKKLYPLFNPKGLIMDTLILSQLLNPDRVGGHSLAHYGECLGIKKPEHEDWSQFSPEMLHRCTEDVHINHKVYDLLMEEAYEPVEGIKYSEISPDLL